MQLDVAVQLKFVLMFLMVYRHEAMLKLVSKLCCGSQHRVICLLHALVR